jgi:hypothetical protein
MRGIISSNPTGAYSLLRVQLDEIMAEEITTTPTASAVADKPGFLQSLMSLVIKPKPTGVTCEYCGWHGTKDDVLKSPRLNEDGAVYQITTCPNCLRNGGLVFYD